MLKFAFIYPTKNERKKSKNDRYKTIVFAPFLVRF